MRPCSAALSPKATADSIWATTPSGFTATPQSIAQVTRCTRMRPSSTDTSATCASQLPKDSCTATPRARPAGGRVPQPDFSAARFSTPRWRGCFASSARR